jgi:class 3 adenylate cyclase/tetratricopeptide (TPR) repeat protein
MTFDEILAQVLDLLQRQGRVSYRALKIRFQLDDDYLEGLKDELIYARQLAIDEEGKVLVWAGEAGTTPAPLEDRGRAPLSYTPTHLAEKILTSKSMLEGERKQVTVLFADLKGSMELLAGRDPEDARRLLDPVLERMMEAVHRYEGTVNQVMGDGIMALFGAPIACEDHAMRAGYAALHMQEAVGRYAEELRRSQGLDVQIRVGLNSGEVVVRAIGSDLRMDYTAVGQTTHLAARMEQLARPGTILLTADTLQLVEGYFEVRALGLVPVKGLTEPIEIYELLRPAPVRSRLQAAAARGLTRFVGRGTELETLRQALERAQAAHGQVVAVVGEPGVGKSRLFYEFTHSHRTEGWLILESSSVSYGRATPYLPVIDLLKAYFQLEARDDARRIREKLTGKLLTLDRTLEPTLPAFLALLDVPGEDPTWQTLDPPQRRQRILDTIKHLLLRESQVQPLLLVFEDLHWIDAETQALLDSLLESLPTARMLLLVNYRPEYEHRWGGKTYYSQLRLDPLPPESAEELLQALLGHDASLDPLKQLLIARTEGNPFFLEESVRTLIETQALVGERSAYRLTQALGSIQVPATVQAVLSARIDRLPPEEKRLLQTAAVIGVEVPCALLQAIAELSEEALLLDLTHLQGAEFLYETSLFPERELTFRHALTHEVAYGSLLQERRRSLHAKIVETIEARYLDRLAELVEQLAHHALRGEVWGNAVTYGRQAGAKAYARGADREVVVYLEQALGALQHLPESRATLEQAIDLRLDLGVAFIALGEPGSRLGHLRAAETLAEALHDQGRLGRVYAGMSDYFWAMGDHDRALEYGQRALPIAAILGDGDLQIAANFMLGLVYRTLGDYHRAKKCFGGNVASLKELLREPSRMRFPPVAPLSYLVWCLAELGEFAEAISRGEEGVRLAEALGQPVGLIFAYRGVGYLYLVKGDLHKAIPALERSLAVARDHPGYLPWNAAALGYAYALAGRIAEAIQLLEEAMQRAATTGRVGQSFRLAYLSEAYLLAGRMESALELALRALTLSREHKEQGHEAYALRLLGEITSRRAPPDVEQAENHYRQAMALAEELAMHPLLAHCRRGLGALYSCVGRLEQARAELSAAIELYRAMEMPFWLTRAEATLAEARRQHDGRKVQGRDEEQRRPNIGERERKRD